MATMGIVDPSFGLIPISGRNKPARPTSPTRAPKAQPNQVTHALSEKLPRITLPSFRGVTCAVKVVVNECAKPVAVCGRAQKVGGCISPTNHACSGPPMCRPALPTVLANSAPYDAGQTLKAFSWRCSDFQTNVACHHMSATEPCPRPPTSHAQRSPRPKADGCHWYRFYFGKLTNSNTLALRLTTASAVVRPFQPAPRPR